MGRFAVVGVGNPLRGDDAVGVHVARSLRDKLPPDVDIIEHDGDVSRLVEALRQWDRVVIVDAVTTGAEFGTIHEFDVSETPLPAEPFRCTTHSFGVGEAIELARSLNGLPRVVWVLGIEGGKYEIGTELSPKVRNTIPRVVEIVLERIRQLRGGGFQ
ncbi:MAG: hydrogenase maturation protease [Candidatus Latescibacterota bacterium]|nr:MAG: hydrogenase maturation protease [Candidatus Latescibacterota bacterium]